MRKQKAVSSTQGQPRTKAPAQDRTGRNQHHLAWVFPRKVVTTFRSSSLTDVLRVALAGQIRQASGAESLLVRCGCENRLRAAPDCSVRIERAGRGEDSQACPCRAANDDGPEAGEDLTPDK